MMVLFLPATLVTAWLLAIFGISAPGSFAGEAFADNAIRWMMALPAGGMFVSSSIMHIVFAKQTAANIGWQSNGFQYEVGCCSFGLGAAGIWAAYLDQSAWFVLATDLPFVNAHLINLLLEKRDPSKVATAVKGKNKQFPEPLITIYEPKAYPVLLQYLAQGYSCPRKMLINSDVAIVEVEDMLIRNINTPEEYKQAIKELT